MAIAITVLGIDVTYSKTRVFAKLALSGNYSTGGDTIDFSTILGNSDGAAIFNADAPPLAGDVSTSTSAGAGWIASFFPGTTIQNGKVKFIVSSTGAEHANGAYTAALAADPNIVGEFIFEKLQ